MIFFVFLPPMANVKFKFNPDTLLFERVKYSFKQRLLQFLPFFTVTLFLSFIILYYSGNFLETPKLNRMKEEQSQILLNMKLLKNEVRKYDNKLADIEYNDDHVYRTYFEVDPLPSSLRDAGSGGNIYYELFSKSRYKDFITDLASDMDRVAKKLIVQSRSFEDIVELAKNKEKRLAARPSIQPVSIKELTRFGSAFGMRIHPILKYPKMHEGIDLTCPTGTKVFAPADGVVIEAGYTSGGYGIRIMIDHGFGYKTVFGHLSRVLVKVGDKMKRGDEIALVGNTGLSTCPHLHYEIIVNGKKVNPFNYYASDLTAEEYDKMINLYASSDPSFDIN
jgi:murein DD-endopeptidase MepM/ murein hydrolase activator NlpD